MMIPSFVLQQMPIILVISAIIAFPLAWVGEYVIGDHGFGVIGNFIVLGFGAIGGIVTLMMKLGLGGSLLNTPYILFLSGGAGGLVMLLVLALIKRLLMR